MRYLPYRQPWCDSGGSRCSRCYSDACLPHAPFRRYLLTRTAKPYRARSACSDGYRAFLTDTPPGCRTRTLPRAGAVAATAQAFPVGSDLSPPHAPTFVPGLVGSMPTLPDVPWTYVSAVPPSRPFCYNTTHFPVYPHGSHYPYWTVAADLTLHYHLPCHSHHTIPHGLGQNHGTTPWDPFPPHIHGTPPLAHTHTPHTHPMHAFCRFHRPPADPKTHLQTAPLMLHWVLPLPACALPAASCPFSPHDAGYTPPTVLVVPLYLPSRAPRRGWVTLPPTCRCHALRCARACYPNT